MTGVQTCALRSKGRRQRPTGRAGRRSASERIASLATFPKVLLTGLGITGISYVLVSITAVALVPPGELSKQGATPLLEVVRVGAPNLPIGAIFPFISMFAVANTALLNMMMASRLLYGMSRERVLPGALGRVHATRRTPWVAILFTPRWPSP